MFRKLTAILTLIFVLVVVPAYAGFDGGLLDNNGFEDGLSDWSVTDKAGDKVACQGDNNHNDNSGLCSYLMKGNTDSDVRLIQKLSAADIVELNGAVASDTLRVRAYGYRYSESALTKLTFKLIIKLDDGTKLTEKTTSLGITGLRLGWVKLDTITIDVAQSEVFKSVKIKAIDKSNAGKQWVDDFNLNYQLLSSS
jgi:hypothetical protein